MKKEITTQQNDDRQNDPHPRILIVDDAPISLRILEKILFPTYTAVSAENGRQALEILKKGGISMVLSDIFMPEMSGLELLRAMHEDSALASIPIMMITADGNTDNEIEALRLGAVDIVRKPFVPQILLGRIHNLFTLQNSFRSAEQNRLTQEKLKLQSETLRFMEIDELTGTLTHQAFYRHVREYLNEHPSQKLEMIRFDLDNFSTINEVMGVKAGDRLLRDIGHKIASYDAFTTDVLVAGRIDADHFAALNNPEKQTAEELFQYVQSWIAENEPEYHANCRFGVYTISDKSMEPSVMCDRALLALRSTKGNYTQRFSRYDDSMRQKLLEEQKLTDEMLPALQSGQFVVYYQPQMNYSTGEMIGAEALIRWKHPEMGLLPPAVFLPLFERNGLITQLDNYVWESVCRQLARWRSRFGGNTAPVSVNISRMDIYGENLCARLTGLTDKYKLPKELLHLEITESAYVDDAHRLCETVEQLSKAGFYIEMDDFGSAYSSLNMLKDIVVDMLKLDMKFLSDTKNSARSGNILSSVVRMARWLTLPVIAEGVETKQQADYLSSIGCLYMQGYYFSKPVPVAEYELFLEKGMIGKADKYKDIDISMAENFWDASTQTALIFNSYVGGAIILQRTGQTLEMLRANDEFFKSIHMTREEYLPYMLNVLLRFSPETQKRYLEMLDLAANGEEAEYELQSLPKSGRQKCWTRNRAKLLAVNGKSEIFYVLVDNITQEKLMHEELAKQQDLLVKLYNGVPCSIMDYSIKGEKMLLIHYNDTTWRMNGYPTRSAFEDVFLKKEPESMVYPDDLPLMLQKVREAKRSDEMVSLECRIRHANGEYYWCEVRLQCSTDPDGNQMLQSICMDISSRIEQETQKYGKLLFSIFDKIYLLDYQADTCRVIKGDTPHSKTGTGVFNLKEICKALLAKYVRSEDQEMVKRFIEPEALRRACAQPAIPFIDYHHKDALEGKSALIRSSAFPVDKDRFLLCSRDITEEKHAAERAREISLLQATLNEQERYRIIVEQTGASVIEWNNKTGEFFHSGNYERYAVSKCDPKAVFQNAGNLNTVHPNDLLVLKKFFSESKSDLPVAEAVLRLRMTDGSYRWTRMRGSFIRDASGKPVRTIGTFTDVDDEIRAKEQLQESGARLSRIIDNIPAGVGIYQIESIDRILPLYLSDRACQLFGFSREEYDARISARLPVHFIPKHDIIAAKQQDALLHGGSFCLPRVRAVRKDGTRFWMWMSCSVTVQAGKPGVCYATMFDINHLVETEQSADSQKELYRLLMESTETITFDYSVLNDTLRLSYAKASGERTEQQYPNYKAYMKSDCSRIDAADKSLLLRPLRAALKRETAGELDFRALGPDEKKHWYHTKFLSLAQDDTVYRVIGRIDNLDHVLQKQEAKLLKAQIDQVTGLRNKDTARFEIEQQMKQRPQAQSDAMLFLDIDNFKSVNDSVGHLDADHLLSKVGTLLKATFRSTDITARYGGDEFLIYMIAPESYDMVTAKASALLKKIRSIPVGNGEYLQCSLGITEIGGALRSFETAFHCADKAMYLAKQNGKNQFSTYRCNSESELSTAR